MKSGERQYSDTICSKTKAINRAGGNVTSADLIQAMVESFRIYGKAESNMSDSNNKVIATVTAFKCERNLCGKGGHKARDWPQYDKIKCKHCS